MRVLTPAEMAKRLPPRLARWSNQLLAAEMCYGIDPFLLAAIMDRETNGGTAPQLSEPGPKGTGDHGFGHGLFQIDKRSHKRFIDACFYDNTPVWADPAFNTLYATRLLRSNLIQLGGDALAAVAAFNCGVGRIRGLARSLVGKSEAERISAYDPFTTGRDYVSDVTRRRATFTSGTQLA